MTPSRIRYNGDSDSLLPNHNMQVAKGHDRELLLAWREGIQEVEIVCAEAWLFDFLAKQNFWKTVFCNPIRYGTYNCVDLRVGSAA